MAKNVLTREEVLKLEEESKKKKNGPRWFLLSYDAGAEIREERMNESFKRVSYVVARMHTTDDFRKVIIRTLRTAKVTQMEEPVETGIWFRDPRTDMSVDDKLNFWEEKFDAYESDFYYCITASLQKDVNPYYADRPNKELQKNFQKLLVEVLEEEKKEK